MIRLPIVALSPTTAKRLAGYQTEVNAAHSYKARVAEAKRLFSLRNKASNATFRAIRATLESMCTGARRCCYCEDSCADEVEHIKPKDLYPEFVFVWENYLYSCGPCNGPKNNRFQVFHKRTGNVHDITRKSGDPIRKPPPGDPLLIDPRQEDPLEFLELEMMDTFFFLPRTGLSSRDLLRAEHTIELLRLNERELLAKARRNAFGTYRARLNEYAQKKQQGATAKQLTILVNDLLETPHPTVWAEMKRQNSDFSELMNLFVRAPEALNW
jgi:uncharacterized protein (TIGR02646 family)